jgi:hypothetical protein
MPLAVIGYVTWWCRPAMWAWPLLLLLLIAPKTPAQILFGNTDMWVTAFIAGAVRWSWPGVLLTFKPSLAFFGAIGVLSRWWWIAAAIQVLASLPLLSYWLEYPTIARNSSAQLSYSFGNLPFFVLPIAAWLVSSRRVGTMARRDRALAFLGRRSSERSSEMR